MRGQDAQQGHMWSYIQPEQRVPQDHPLRAIRAMVDQALQDLSPRFALLYSHTGRPSIPPEQLLRALLLPNAEPTVLSPEEDPGNPTVDFRGEKRSNATHQSTTDPDAQLVRKSRGQAAILAYRGHVLMENRHGLVVQALATQVVGASEPATALGLATAIPGNHRATLGGDNTCAPCGRTTRRCR